MNIEDDPKTYDYIETLVKTAKRTNAGTVLSAMKNCGKWDGASVFIIVATRNAEKFDVVDTLVENLREDD